MGKLRFVQQGDNIVRLDLSDGDWVEVKKKLTVGESRAAMASVIGEVNTDGWRRPNLKVLGLAEVAAYIVDWSLRDAKDKPVPFSLDALKNLEESFFDEIDKALDAHKAAMLAAGEQEKNAQGGGNASSATSPSAA
jgi:hypothetical protein